MEASRKFPASVHSASAARRFTGELLRHQHAASTEAKEAALLLVSELVTNAVVHARTPVDVSLEVDGTRLRAEVRDASPRRPRRREPGDTGGFGLWLLDELAHDWGVRTGNAGKTVWFALQLVPQAGEATGDAESISVGAG